MFVTVSACMHMSVKTGEAAHGLKEAQAISSSCVLFGGNDVRISRAGYGILADVFFPSSFRVDSGSGYETRPVWTRLEGYCWQLVSLEV